MADADFASWSQAPHSSLVVLSHVFRLSPMLDLGQFSCEGPPECGLASHRCDLIWVQAEHQEFTPRPGVVGQSSRAGGRGLERHVFADEVVVDQVSIEAELEVALGLGDAESATGQRGEGVT